MGLWGKVLGGVAGFAMGGPFGAVVGAAMGHAADERGALGGRPGQWGGGLGQMFGGPGFGPARLMAMLGGREQLFAMVVVVLSAKLAKVDGPVNRLEIDAFKRQFRIPPEGVRDVGRLFDQARDSRDPVEPYARQLGDSFADNRGLLEDVMAALFNIARADKPLTVGEQDMLASIHTAFGLDQAAWDRLQGGRARMGAGSDGSDPYAVLGIDPGASPEELRARWKQLMREHHPDTLAARGVPSEFIQRASDKVARINAAWDRIKRDRKL